MVIGLPLFIQSEVGQECSLGSVTIISGKKKGYFTQDGKETSPVRRKTELP